MRSSLVTWVVIVAALAAVGTVFALFRLADPPDATAAFLGGLWLTFPYLAAAGLAALVRRNRAGLVTLLTVLVVAGAVGLMLLGNAVNQRAISRHEVETAVLSGEDPNHGPAAMRKTGADAGAFFTGAFSILLCVVLPPVQLAGIAIPTLVAWAVSAATRPSPAHAPVT